MSTDKIREEFEVWHGRQRAMLIQAGEPTAARNCESLKEIYFSAWEASRSATHQKADSGLVGVIANEMNRLGYGLHESHAASILHAINAAQHQGEPAAFDYESASHCQVAPSSPRR